MKKILTAFILASLASVSFGNPSPELLKNKADFSKTELFESNAVFADKAANAALLRDYEANPPRTSPTSFCPSRSAT